MRTNEIICNDAARIANDMAQQRIPVIGKAGTNVFESHADLGGKELALRMKFDYSGWPEVQAQLHEIGQEAMAESIRKNARAYIAGVFQKVRG